MVIVVNVIKTNKIKNIIYKINSKKKKTVYCKENSKNKYIKRGHINTAVIVKYINVIL